MPTAIEWTDETWNPITGCSVVSRGCTNCYAMRLAGGRLRNEPSRIGLTDMTRAGPVWNGQVRLNEGMLDQPLRWRRPREMFVCAHGDLFHPAVPEVWIDYVYAVMAATPRHTYQVLTKRPERARDYMYARGTEDGLDAWCDGIIKVLGIERWKKDPNHYDDIIGDRNYPLENVWLGVSAEDQLRAEERIPVLLDIPAAVRFVSAEPLLGPLDIRPWLHAADAVEYTADMLDWIIVGGESGPAARPMDPSWADDLRLQTDGTTCSFFFKQGGGRNADKGGKLLYGKSYKNKPETPQGMEAGP